MKRVSMSDRFLDFLKRVIDSSGNKKIYMMVGQFPKCSMAQNGFKESGLEEHHGKGIRHFLILASLISTRN